MPADRCPTCGRPKSETAHQGERLKKYILRAFSGDPTAYGVVEDGFRVLMTPEAEGGAGCANELEAVLSAFRECVATWGTSK